MTDQTRGGHEGAAEVSDHIGEVSSSSSDELAMAVERGSAAWFRQRAGQLGCENWRGPTTVLYAADVIDWLTATIKAQEETIRAASQLSDNPGQLKPDALALAVDFMDGAAAMLGRGEMPAPGTKYAADWYLAHATVLETIRADGEALKVADDALRSYACCGLGAPCIRDVAACRTECGQPAGLALDKVAARLAARQEGATQ